MAAQVISTLPSTYSIVRSRTKAPFQNGVKRTSVRVAAVSEQELGVKLPATHVSASQNALKQIESANLQGINRTCLFCSCEHLCRRWVWTISPQVGDVVWSPIKNWV